MAKIVAVLFVLHYCAYFNAEEEVVLTKHASFLVTSKGEKCRWIRMYVVAVFILRTFINSLQEEGLASIIE